MRHLTLKHAKKMREENNSYYYCSHLVHKSARVHVMYACMLSGIYFSLLASLNNSQGLLMADMKAYNTMQPKNLQQILNLKLKSDQRHIN
jgi:hypothetical protein